VLRIEEISEGKFQSPVEPEKNRQLGVYVSGTAPAVDLEGKWCLITISKQTPELVRKSPDLEMT